MELLAGLAAIAVAMAIGAFVLAGGLRDRGHDDVINVTGSARRSVVSDYVIWSASVSSQRGAPAAAADELAGWTRRVRAFLKAHAVLDSELSVDPVSTETVTTSNGRVAAFRLTRYFQIRSRRVAAIADVVERSGDLISEGIPLAGQPPQYIYTRLSRLRPQLVAAATRDAMTRARALVKATTGELGGLRSVNVGVFQVTQPNSTDVSDSGVYDTSTLRKDVTAVVNVGFALE